MLRISFGPFRYRLFAALWLAGTISNIGSFIHLMAATWLMTELSSSPLSVALIQTANFLPFFLFTLPAGVIADKIDRVKLLLITQGVMFFAVAILSILVYSHLVQPWILLFITFILGIASGINLPTWQATLGELVPARYLASALTLNSLSYNIARTIGPAIGGIIINLHGVSAPFLFDTFSFLGVLAVLYYWMQQPRNYNLSQEKFHLSLINGLRFAFNHPLIRLTLIQTACFTIAGSGIWTLLALIARNNIGTNAEGYGILLGSLGLGAIISGIILLIYRSQWENHMIIKISVLTYGLATFFLSFIHNFHLAFIFCFIAGFVWLAISTTFNITVQLASPPALKARIFAVYLTINTGAFALGSYVLGHLAEYIGCPWTLFLAGTYILGTTPFFWKVRIAD